VRIETYLTGGQLGVGEWSSACSASAS